MHTVGFSRRAAADAALDESLPLNPLHAALARADAVVVAIALTDGTRRLMNGPALAACKRGALIVNIARGGIIDQPALIEALESGQIGAAGLDVTNPEPMPADDPLWHAPNVLIAPHFGGSGSAASIKRLARGVTDNLTRLTTGQALLHIVPK